MAENRFLQSPLDKLIEDSKGYELPKIEAPKREATRSAASSMRTTGLMPPAELQGVFEEASAETGVPVNIIAALAQQESSYNPMSVNKASGASGLFNYMKPTAEALGINPFDVRQSTMAAAKQFRERLDKGESVEEAIAHHFAGPDRKLWGPKTRRYVQEVLGKAGVIGEGLMKGSASQAPKAEEFDPSAIQAELDAKEPGRFKVLSPEEAERYQRRSDLISGQGQLQAAQDALKPGAPSPLTPENQQQLKTQQQAAPSPLTMENQRRVEAGLPPKDTRPYQTFTEATGAALSNVPERFQQSIAGLIQLGGEDMASFRNKSFARNAAALGITPGDYTLLAWAGNEKLIPQELMGQGRVKDALEYVKQNIAQSLNEQQLKQLGAAGIVNPDEITAYAKQWRADTMKTMAEVRPEPESMAFYGSAAIGSLAEMGPMIAGAIITRSPKVAMAIMGGQVGGQAYATGREKGLSEDQAQTYALLTAAAEAVPEALVVGRLLKPGTGAVRKVLEGTVMEGAQEAVTAALQAGIDQQMIDPDMTLKEALVQIRDGAIIGALAGGGMGAITAGADAVGNRQPKERRERIEPTIDGATPAAKPASTTPAAAADTTPAAQVPEQVQPVPPAGPLTRSAAKATQTEGADRVVVQTPTGQVAGTVESYEQGTNGAWSARILGDDGQFYQFTDKDGVQIAPEAQQVAPEPMADTQAQVDAIRDPSSGKDTALITPESQPVDTEGLATIPTNQGVLVTRNPEKAAVVEAKGGQLTTDEVGALLDYTTPKAESDGTVVQARDAAGNVVNEEATNQQTLQQAVATAEQKAPAGGSVNVTDAPAVLEERAERIAIEQMGEPELRARMKYLAGQAKATGGWNKTLMQERKKVEKAINALVAQRENADQASVSPETVTAPAPAEASNQMTVKDAAPVVEPSAPETAAADQKPVKWFGTQEKADAFIAKKGMADTHEVVPVSRSRFEIREKANPEGWETVPGFADRSRKEVMEAVADMRKYNDGLEFRTRTVDGKLLIEKRPAVVNQQLTTEKPADGMPQLGQKVVLGKGRQEATIADVKGNQVIVQVGGNVERMSLGQYKARLAAAERAAAETVSEAQTPKVGRQQAITEAQGAAAEVLSQGGTEADASRAATDLLIKRMADDPSISIANDAPAAVQAAKQRKPASRKEQAEQLVGKVGDTVTPSKAFDYLTAGKPMVVEAIDSKGGVYLRDPVTGSGTQINSLIAERQGVTFAKQEKAAEQKPVTTKKVSEGVTATVIDPSAGREATPAMKWVQSSTEERLATLKAAGFTNESQLRVFASSEFVDLPTRVRDKLEGKQPEQSNTLKDGSKVIGRRADGKMIYEDKNGVRYYADSGVRIQETVSLRPTREGMVVERQALTPEFMTTEEQAAEQPKAEAKPALSKNKIFTEDAAEKARALLRSKLTQLNSGIDPEIMQAGITLAGYHIEKGARTFAAYAEAMLADLGGMVRPYLKSWYMGVKYDPRAAGFDGMSSAAEVEAYNLDEVQDDTKATEASIGADAEGSAPSGVQADGESRAPGAVPGKPDGRVRAERRSSKAERAEQDGSAGAEAKRPADAVRADRGNGADAGSRADQRAQNYRIQPGELKRTGSWKATAEQNIRIVELVKQITAEGRQATPEEKQLLTKFTGWGASEIANGVFPDKYGRYKEGWRELGERLQAALTPEEYAQAKRTTQYAHYTSEPIIRSVYGALDRMGFNGGQVLEPGMGIGLFNGLMPDSMVQHSTYTGIEYDSITGNIAKLLYPESNVVVGDFTATKLPRDFFDAAIGNPPFGQIKIQSDPEYKKQGFLLHDYFFAKTIDRVKPGGLLVFVTSKGTMDKATDRARKYLSERADLVGAIRLPQTAFKDNAGTEVVTDVIFLRKRRQGEEPAGEAWAGLAEVQTAQGPAFVNEYFAAHPEMVLGRHAKTGSMYRADEYTVEPIDGDIEQLFAKAVENLPEGIYRPERGSQAERAAVQRRDYDPKVKKEGGIYVADDGALMQVESGQGVPLTTRLGSNGKELELKPREVEWLKGYAGVRDALKQAQYDQLNEGAWEKSLKALNKAYDAFTKAHGPILAHSVTERENADGSVTVTRRFKNEPLIRLDAEGALAYALEVINTDGTISKGAVLNGRTLNKPVTPTITSSQDALFVSLNDTGRFDLAEIAKLAGKTEAEVVSELGDAIYEDPSAGWTTADEYLSGNVVRKLKEAEAAARLNKTYQRNVEALKNVQPRALAPQDITVQLGSAWIPASDVQNFAAEVMGDRLSVSYSPVTGQWSVDGQSSRTSEWGTGDKKPADILEGVLNNRQLKVTYRDADGKTHTDPEGTEKVNDIAKKLRAEFKRWVWADAKRADRLAKFYNENYNNIAPRQFDGSHLTLPGVSTRFNLRPHQKRAIWRTIQQGDTYYAHAVGAGKTFTMIASGMEERRLGLVKKPMYVVPNHMLAQFSKEFLELYPTASIMVADEQNFHTHNRRKFVAQAALNDPDAIVITHSAFGRIGMSPEYSERFIRDQISDWEMALDEVDNQDRVTRKQIERRIEQLENRLKAIIDGDKKDQVLSFEELGVDRLYVDEGHEFRKLDFPTNRGNIKGIDSSGSQRAMDLFMKVQYLRQKNPARALVMASGTPVTNTMGELFTVQRFFQPQQLEEDGDSSFDAWAAHYGEVVDGLEQNAAGGYETVSRFAKFVNVPELMSRVRSFMDILTSNQLGDLVQRPDVIGGGRQVVVTPVPDGYKAYQKDLENRIKAIRNRKGPPKPGDDIILNVIADGRFSAIDMRFVDPTLPSDPNSKLNRTLDDMIEAYHATAGNEYTTDDKADPLKGGSLMLFTDIGLGEQSAASRGFNMKAWIEKRLIEGGVKPEHIAFMRDHKAHAKKERLFDDLRQGRKRILIGGKDMETGVNAQKRLVYLGHLDAPWFPASVEQREGRIIRQGNQNKNVTIKAYATKGSYDSTMWGMNARKARFIEQAMSGDTSVRNMEDVSEASAFEMAAALASGDERYLKLAGLKGDVERLSRLYSAHLDDQRRLRSQKMGHESSIKHNTEQVAELKAAIAKRKPIAAGEFSGKVGAATFDKRDDFSSALFDKFKELAEAYTAGEQQIGEIGGFPITYNGVELRGGNFAADASLEIPGSPDPLLVFPVDPEASIAGIATRAANQVNSLDRELNRREGLIAESRQEIEKIDRRLGASFPEASELTEKREALAELESELEAESKAAEAEAAAAAAEVEETEVEQSIKGDPRYSVQDGQVIAEFGPVFQAESAAGAVERLMDAKTGEAIITKEGLGEVSLVYGNSRLGLEHIARRRSESFMQRLPELIENGTVYSKPGQTGRVFIGNDAGEAVVRLDWNGQAKTWLVSAYEKYPDLQAAEAPAQGRRSQVVAQRTEAGMSANDVRKAIAKGAFAAVVDKMVEKGLIVIHSNSKTLPDNAGRNKPGVQAVTDESNVVHLVASNLTPANARAVLYHEMFHSGVESLVGTKRWGELQGRLASLYRQAEKSKGKAREIFDRARQRVADAKAQDAVATRMEVEEFGAYAIEEYESLPAGFRKWVDDVVGAIKAWLFSRYGKQIGQVTPAQLRALAKDALITMALNKRGELFGPAATWFSVQSDLQRALAMTEDEYIASVNPTGKRGDPDDRMILNLGDLSAPADAQRVGQFTDKDGRNVKVLKDADGNFYAVQGSDVLGMVGPQEESETVIELVEQAKGKGIGKGLMKAYLKENPLAQSGGFTEAGEANRRAAFRELKEEFGPRFSVLPDETAIEDATAALDKQEQFKPDYIGQLNDDLGRVAKFVLHPRQIAALHKDFTPVYRTAINQFEMRDSIIDELQQDHAAYDVLPQAGKKKVNAVLELGRLLSATYSEKQLRDGIANPGEKTVVKFTDGGSTFRAKEKVNALLSQEGEVIKLTDQEIDAYLRLRAMFDKALDKFKDQTLEDFGFPELAGKKDAAKQLLDKITPLTPANQVERLTNIARFIGEIEQAKRTGYTPFARYGDYVVAVKEQQFPLKMIHDPDSGGWITRDLPQAYEQFLEGIGAQWDELEGGYRLDRTQRQALIKENEKTVHSAKVEFTLRDKALIKAGRQVEELPSVKKALAEAEKWKAGNPDRRIVAFEVIQKKPEGGVKLSDVDALAEVAMLDADAWDAVRDQLADAIKGQSFRKHFFQSDNVPGYTADFERAIADYMAGMAGYLSRRHYARGWDDAIGAIKAKNLHEYATKYRAYANEPQEELAMLRQVGFFHYIAGVPATAFVNLTQVPLMTVPALGQIAPMPMVLREVGRAYKDALAMVRLNKRVGLDFFDPTKAPADIRKILVKSWAEGMFVPLQTYEVMATARQRNVGHRQAAKKFNKLIQVTASLFSFAERLNRLVTFIASARLAEKPGVKAKAMQVYGNNALASQTMLKNWNAETLADFMIDETQFRMGKANRPVIMRGVGAAIMQFKGFVMQSLEAWFRLATQNGKEGAKAVALSIGFMVALGGLWGIPGSDDLRDLIEKAYKQVTARDLDLKTELRKGVYDMTGQRWLSEVASKGATYPFGLDLSRVGMGGIAPDSPLQVFGIPADLIAGRGTRAFQKGSQGDAYGAIAEFLPNFLKNPVTAYGWSQNGVRDGKGRLIMDEADVGGEEMALKSLGFQPSKITDIRDYNYAQYRMETGVDALKRSYANKIAMLYARMEKHPEKAAELNEELSDVLDELEAYNATASDEARVIITPQTMRERMRREMGGAASDWGRERKQARGAAEQLREVFGLSEE